MHKKINLAIFFGGRSAEHEVSIISAQNVIGATSKKKYNLTFVGIAKNGDWLNFSEKEIKNLKVIPSQKNPENKLASPLAKNGEFFLQIGKLKKKINVVFPVMHGTFGEDGTIQGLCKIFNVPFVGPGVLGSSVCMDKDTAKRLLRDADIPTSKFLVFRKDETKEISFQKVKKVLGLPMFVKPANLGSSIGISKVKSESDFSLAIKNAFSYDNKIILEQNISGKEIECSVLGNKEKLLASVTGEIIPTHEFYSYVAKYLDPNGAMMAIPAKIPKNISKKVQELAKKVFETLGCEGMGRVDFFLTPKNKIFVNEVNTIPGFTLISMYPKLLEVSGIPYFKLIDTLIDLAIKRHKRESKLKINR